MSIKRVVIFKSRYITCHRVVNTDTKRKHYMVTYQLPFIWDVTADNSAVVRCHFSRTPGGSQTKSLRNSSWKYSNKKEAMDLVTLALIKWPDL